VSAKHVVAGIILQREQDPSGDRFLICQRARHDAMPLKWEFAGGKVEPDETPEIALVRELHEELQIAAIPGGKLKSLRHEYAHGLIIHLDFFLVESFTGELTNQVFEQILWVSREEITDFDFLEADWPVVHLIAAGKLP
jgi:8-oxo-dGTP diphosphatase